MARGRHVQLGDPDSTGGLSEQGAYLGIPVIVMLIIYFARAWRTIVGRILLGLIVVAGVWSLGAKLHVKGPTRLDMPAVVLAHLPVFDQLAPARIALYVALAASVAVALWLSDARTRPWQWGLAALSVVSLIPATNATYPGTRAALFHSKVSEPRFFSTGMYRSFLRRDEVVLPVPWASQGTSMLWQAQADFYFRMASGHSALRRWHTGHCLSSSSCAPTSRKPGAAPSLRSLVASPRCRRDHSGPGFVVVLDADPETARSEGSPGRRGARLSRPARVA